MGLGVVHTLGVVWGSPGTGFCKAWNFHAEAITASCRANGKVKLPHKALNSTKIVLQEDKHNHHCMHLEVPALTHL